MVALHFFVNSDHHVHSRFMCRWPSSAKFKSKQQAVLILKNNYFAAGAPAIHRINAKDHFRHKLDIETDGLKWPITFAAVMSYLKCRPGHFELILERDIFAFLQKF